MTPSTFHSLVFARDRLRAIVYAGVAPLLGLPPTPSRPADERRALEDLLRACDPRANDDEFVAFLAEGCAAEAWYARADGPANPSERPAMRWIASLIDAMTSIQEALEVVQHADLAANWRRPHLGGGLDGLALVPPLSAQRLLEQIGLRVVGWDSLREIDTHNDLGIQIQAPLDRAQPWAALVERETLESLLDGDDAWGPRLESIGASFYVIDGHGGWIVLRDQGAVRLRVPEASADVGSSDPSTSTQGRSPGSGQAVTTGDSQVQIRMEPARYSEVFGPLVEAQNRLAQLGLPVVDWTPVDPRSMKTTLRDRLVGRPIPLDHALPYIAAIDGPTLGRLLDGDDESLATFEEEDASIYVVDHSSAWVVFEDEEEEDYPVFPAVRVVRSDVGPGREDAAGPDLARSTESAGDAGVESVPTDAISGEAHATVVHHHAPVLNYVAGAPRHEPDEEARHLAGLERYLRTHGLTVLAWRPGARPAWHPGVAFPYIAEVPASEIDRVKLLSCFELFDHGQGGWFLLGAQRAALHGGGAVQIRGTDTPSTSSYARRKLRRFVKTDSSAQSDAYHRSLPIQNFLAERCHLATGLVTGMTDFYRDYVVWCQTPPQDGRILNWRTVEEVLGYLDLEVVYEGGRAWVRGVRLLDLEDKGDPKCPASIAPVFEQLDGVKRPCDVSPDLNQTLRKAQDDLEAYGLTVLAWHAGTATEFAFGFAAEIPKSQIDGLLPHNQSPSIYRMEPKYGWAMLSSHGPANAVLLMPAEDDPPAKPPFTPASENTARVPVYPGSADTGTHQTPPTDAHLGRSEMATLLGTFGLHVTCMIEVRGQDVAILDDKSWDRLQAATIVNGNFAPTLRIEHPYNDDPTTAEIAVVDPKAHPSGARVVRSILAEPEWVNAPAQVLPNPPVDPRRLREIQAHLRAEGIPLQGWSNQGQFEDPDNQHGTFPLVGLVDVDFANLQQLISSTREDLEDPRGHLFEVHVSPHDHAYLRFVGLPTIQIRRADPAT